MFLIMIPLAAAVPSLGIALLATSGASQIVLRSFYFIDDQYTAMSYLFYAMGLVALWAYSRPFSMARLRAYLDDKPEPKDPPKPSLPAAATAK
jgi:hypothetical protein